LGKRDEGGRVLAGAGGWSAHVGAGGPEPASSFFLWRRMLSELRAFNEKHSHCQVPQDYSVTPELGTWVSTQRQLYRWGKLSAKKIALLEAIGFVWGASRATSGQPTDMAEWEEMYAALVAFKEQHKHCGVPKVYPDNPKLGQWVTNQRTQHRNGKLSDGKTALLEAIGFLWEASLAKDEAEWEEMFTALVVFKKETGHCGVPLNHPDNARLGIWVMKQRAQHYRSRLSPERVALMEAFGFLWDASQASRIAAEIMWDEMYSALEATKKETGHCQVPQNYPDHPKLASWVNSLRQNRRKLSDERTALLEAIGFVWDEGAGQLGSDAPPPAALQGGGGAPPAPKAPRQSKVEVFGELPSHSAPHLQAG